MCQGSKSSSTELTPPPPSEKLHRWFAQTIWMHLKLGVLPSQWWETPFSPFSRRRRQMHSRTDPLMSAPGLTIECHCIYSNFRKQSSRSRFAVQVLPALRVYTQLFRLWRTYSGIPHNPTFHTGRRPLSFSGYLGTKASHKILFLS